MKGTANEKSRERDDVLEELFRHATARERPNREDERAIRESLHGEWQSLVQVRGSQRKRRWLAVAASLAIALVTGTILLRPQAPAVAGIQVATVDVLNGSAWVRKAESESLTALALASVLETGHQISTSHGAGLSTRWRSGIVMRLDQNSRIRIDSPGSIELLSGRVYIDTDGADSAAAKLVLSTPAGSIQHIGSRYMVAVRLGTTSVSVRDGQVRLGDSETADVGERVVVNASGERRREIIPIYGDAWQWTESLATPFLSDGRTLAEFFTWLERESGRRVTYETTAAERRAGETILRGEIDLDPMEALALVMQTTDLAYGMVDGEIIISKETER